MIHIFIAGQTDEQTNEPTDGSTRGPRGPKKARHFSNDVFSVFFFNLQFLPNRTPFFPLVRKLLTLMARSGLGISPMARKFALRLGELVPGEGSRQHALHRKACYICLI